MCRGTWIVLFLLACSAPLAGCLTTDDGGSSRSTDDDDGGRRGEPDVEEDSVTPTPDVTTVSDDDPTSIDDPVDPEALRILELTMSADTMFESGQLSLSALVAPGAEEQVLGGQLVDPVDGTLVMNLTQDGPGLFTASLSWSQLNEMEPIYSNFGPTQRELKVRFFGSSGNEATGTIRPILSCAVATESICAGDCADVTTDLDHCGACHQPVQGDQQCVEGDLVCPSGYPLGCDDGTCVDPEDIHSCGACGHDCNTVLYDRGLSPLPDGFSSCLDSACRGIAYGDEVMSCTELCRYNDLSCTQVDSGGRAWVGEVYYENNGFSVITDCGDTPPETHPDDSDGLYPISTLACVCTDA